MRTAKVVNDALGRLMELGGFTAESEPDFALIRDELKDRESYIRDAYEGWEEDAEERFDIKLRSTPLPEDMVTRAELNEISARYDDLKDRYKKAFFSGEAPEQVVTTSSSTGTNSREIDEDEDELIDGLFKEVK